MSREEYKQKQWNDFHRLNEEGKVERRCTQCEQWLEENLNNYYYKNKNKPSLGYSPWCKDCTRIKANKYREDHADDNIRRCHDYYHTNKDEDNEKYQKIARDREKNREYQRKYHRNIWSKRPENIIKTRTYAKNHRQHDISDKEWTSCLKVFNYKCAYCGISEEEHVELYKQRLHKEHSDDDGYNDLRNAIPSCRRCNSYKHQYNMEEWFRQQDYFDEDKLTFINWWVTEGYKEYIEDKPPYRLLKEKNKQNNKFHWNLWSVDEKRNLVDIIATKDKKKDLNINIEKYFKLLSNK